MKKRNCTLTLFGGNFVATLNNFKCPEIPYDQTETQTEQNAKHH